jgi:NADH dehydrogenase
MENSKRPFFVGVRGMPESKRVVIVGSGFAGFFAAVEFGRLAHLVPGLEVTLVDKNNYHMFMPLLYHVGTGGIEAGNICFPIRATLNNGGTSPPVMFREAEVTGIDTENKKVVCDRAELEYEYLIFALGSTTNFYGIPGLEDNGVPLKTIEDGIAMHNRILESFEAALLEEDEQKRREMLTFVVVGGGATGVELSTTMALFVFRTLNRDFPPLVRLARVLLIEATGSLLHGMRLEVGRLALKQARKLGVEVRLNCLVSKATPDGIETKDGESIPSRNVTWVGGIKPLPIADDLHAERAKDGRIAVSDSLEVPNRPGLYVAGDSAYCLRHDTRSPYPPTAQSAKRMGKTCALNIVRSMNNLPPLPFRYKYKGDLVFLGRNYAVGEFMGRVVSGLPAFYMYQGYHLVSIAGFKNRLVTLLDWAYDYFYRRSTVKL